MKAALYPFLKKYVLLDELKVFSWQLTGWCCLPGGQWLILSTIVKVVTKENHLHSYIWVCSCKRDPVILVQMCLTCEEGYLSCTESTRSVHPLWILLLLSFTCLLSLCSKERQRTRSLRCAMAHSWTNPLMKTRKAESGEAWREPCVLVQQDVETRRAGCFWYLDLINHP